MVFILSFWMLINLVLSCLVLSCLVLSHLTIKAKVILALFYQKSYPFFTKVKVSMFILHHSEDTNRRKHYIVTVTFKVIQGQRSWCQI